MILRDINAPSNEKLDAEISLRGAMLLYESYARPLNIFLAQSDSAPEKSTLERKDSKVIIGLDGEWVSHELSRFLGALNYLHNVSVLNTKLHEKNVSYRLTRPQTRSHVYRNAQLYFYLDKSEELRIRQIHISSPGIVEFATANFEYGALLVSILYVANRLPKWIDEVITLWSRLKNELRDQRIRDRQEQIDRRIDDFFENEIIPRIRGTDCNLDEEGLVRLKSAIKEFSENKLADPISTTDHILRSGSIWLTDSSDDSFF